MQLLLEVPNHLPDAAHCSPQQFIEEAKLAMAIKLFEIKRLSSGMASHASHRQRRAEGDGFMCGV